MKIKLNIVCFIVFTAILMLSGVASARMDIIETPPVEQNYKTYKKIDSTGGFQNGGGIWVMPTALPKVGNLDIAISRKDLNIYRGPDIFNKCAYYGSSLVSTGNTCISNLTSSTTTTTALGNGSSCIKNSDCLSGNCTGGSCSAAGTDFDDGAACTSDSACDSGICSTSTGKCIECTSANLDNCETNQVCKADNTCGGDNADSCSSDTDCISNKCDTTTNTCKEDVVLANLENGVTCTADSQCSSNHCTSGICSTQSDGSSCTANSECSSNSCVSGVCSVSNLAEGATCTGNSECNSGICSGNSCVECTSGNLTNCAAGQTCSTSNTCSSQSTACPPSSIVAAYQARSSGSPAVARTVYITNSPLTTMGGVAFTECTPVANSCIGGVVKDMSASTPTYVKTPTYSVGNGRYLTVRAGSSYSHDCPGDAAGTANCEYQDGLYDVFSTLTTTNTCAP